jgi:PIN domain nuclease of toxin-antitoxin system
MILARTMFVLNPEPSPLSLELARRAGALLNPHRDPFDRMLAVQAEIEDIPLVTADPAFRHFFVTSMSEPCGEPGHESAIRLFHIAHGRW